MSGLISSFSTPKKGQVVEITKDVTQLGGKTLTLDEKAIEEVFGRKNVVNSPVAIYCIAGMLRKGKSFFLNMAIRYLKFKFGERSMILLSHTGSWLDDKTAKVNEGFEWRGGSEAHTKGILIWSEPFWFDTPQYGKVAVFLMDSQGIGDNMSTPITDATLFSLSTLFSSYLIYNTDSVMNRTDLDQFKTFTDFGRKLQINKQEPNQRLLFLRRDWGSAEYAFGFEGGTDYLKKTLNDVSNTSKHYQSLCTNIKSSFKEVKCALLPHPGKPFVRLQTTPTLADIDDDFLEELEKLLQDMFDKICVKMNGQYPTTGEDIISQAIILTHHMKTNFIDADMLFKVVSENFLSNIVGRCEEMFVADAKHLTDNFYTNDELIIYHQNLIKKVLTLFDQEMKVSSEQRQEDNRESLEAALKEREFTLKNYNDVCKQGIQDLYRALVNDVLESFKDAVSADFEPDKRTNFRYIEESQFEETMKVKESLAMSLFEETALNMKMSPDTFTSYREKLENELSLQKKLCKSLNYFFMFEVEKELLKASIQAIEVLKRSWGKNHSQEGDAHQWLFNTVEALLESYLRSSSVDPNSGTIIEKSKEELTENLYNLANIFAKGFQIERTGQKAGVQVSDLFAQIKTDFKEKVSKVSMIDMDTEDRKNVYIEVRDEMLLKIPKHLEQDCRETIILLCNNLEEECEFENQLSKDKYFLELLTVKAEIAQKINQFLDVDKKYKFGKKFFPTEVRSKLEQLEKEKVNLLKVFTKRPFAVQGEWLDLAAKTKERLNDFFAHATETTKQQVDIKKVHDREVAEKIQRITIMRYTKQMEEMLRKTKVKKRQLMDVHGRFLREYKSNVERKLKDDPTVNATYSTFEEKMKGQLLRWFNLKRYHKKMYHRNFEGLSEVIFKVMMNLKALFDEDPSSMILRKIPPGWALPETGFGELTPKFPNLMLMK